GTAPPAFAGSRSSCPQGFPGPVWKLSRGRRSSPRSGSSIESRRSHGFVPSETNTDAPRAKGSAMSPTTLMGVQFTFSLVLVGLVAKWYVWPALNALPTPDALAPLFLVHGLRYLPSSAFAPGQIAPTVPMDAMKAIAYGDLASAVLALV